MNLNELNSGAGAPASKPWLRPVVKSIEAETLLVDSLAVNGRVTQEQKAGGHLTPYSLWRALGDLNVAGQTLTFAMGSFIGPVLIPAASCYNGMGVKIIVSGLLTTTAAADTLTLSIRNLAGTYVHAVSNVFAPLGTAATACRFEFNIQIAQTGAAGVGKERASSRGSVQTGNSFTETAEDAATFDSTAGVEYYLYAQHSAAGCTFVRQLAYAVIEA